MPDDPLHQALVEGTLAVLLGGTNAHFQSIDASGNVSFGHVTIPSVFVERIKYHAFNGKYDSIIEEAMSKVSADQIAKALEGLIAEQVISGLKIEHSMYNRNSQNWLAERAKEIAITACKEALSADEELMDILRTKIGAEVDRNRVGITVNLSDPEN